MRSGTNPTLTMTSCIGTAKLMIANHSSRTSGGTSAPLRSKTASMSRHDSAVISLSSPASAENSDRVAQNAPVSGTDSPQFCAVHSRIVPNPTSWASSATEAASSSPNASTSNSLVTGW